MANKKRDEPVEEVEWEVKEILAENVKKKLLKISWEGTDSNGDPWAPTWEPYSCASPFLLREWEEKKKAQSDHAHRRSSKAALQNADIVRNKSRSRSRSSSSSSSDGSTSHRAPQTQDRAQSTQAEQSASPVPVVEVITKKRKRPTSVVYPGIESGSSYVPTSQSQATTTTSATQNSTTTTDSNSYDVESAEVRALMGEPLFLPTSMDDGPANDSSLSMQAKPKKKKRKVSFGTVTTKRHRNRDGSVDAEEPEDGGAESDTVEKIPSSAPDPDNDDFQESSGRQPSPDRKGKGKLVRYDDKKEQERIANRQKNMARREKLFQKKADKRSRGENVSTSEDDYALPADGGSAHRKKSRTSQSDTRNGSKEAGKKSRASDQHRRQSPPLRSLPSNLQPRTVSTSKSTISDASTTSTDAFTALMEHATSEHAPTAKELQKRNDGKRQERQPSPERLSRTVSDARTAAQKKADKKAREIIASASPERRSASLNRDSNTFARASSSVSATNNGKSKETDTSAMEADVSQRDTSGRLPTFKKKRKSSNDEGTFTAVDTDPAGTLFRRDKASTIDPNSWPAPISTANDDDDNLPPWNGEDDFQGNDFANEWPLPAPLATNNLEDASTVIVPDSQPANNSSLQIQEQMNADSPDQVRIGRTLRRVPVPEPAAFKPFLKQRNDSQPKDPWGSQDTESIDQFSSQPGDQRSRWPTTIPQLTQHASTSRVNQPEQHTTSLRHVETSTTRPLSQMQRPRRPTVDQANIESPAEKRLRSKQLMQAAASESEEDADEEQAVDQNANIQHDDNMDFDIMQDVTSPQEAQKQQSTTDLGGTKPDNGQTSTAPVHPSLPTETLKAAARAVQDASTMTDSIPEVDPVPANIEQPGQVVESTAQEMVDTGPVVLETSKSLALANNKLRSSTLLTDADLKMEISIFLEAPEYYAISGRALTMKPLWELELERDEAGNSWFMVIKPQETEWRLEKRQKAKAPSAGASLNANSAYASLQAQHEKLADSYATLQKASDASILRIGALESDLNHIRGRHKQAAEEADLLSVENAKLKAEIQRLTQSVETGVRQVQLFVQAKEARLKEELARAQTALSVTQTMAKMADHDSIRQKAARTEELEARERMRLQNAVLWPAINPLAAQPGLIAEESYNQAVPAAALNAQYGEDDESEDEDFRAGSSSDGRSSPDDTSDDDLPYAGVMEKPQATELPQPVMEVQGSIVQQPVSVDVALRSVLDDAERALDQGLPSHEAIPPLFDGMLQAIDPNVIAPAILFPEVQVPVPLISVAEAMDTSGETTEVTATSSSHRAVTESQSQGSSAGRASAGSQAPRSASSHQLETEDVLELDSALLDSQDAYQCQIGLAKGHLCGRLFDSQKSMYEHLRQDHNALG